MLRQTINYSDLVNTKTLSVNMRTMDATPPLSAIFKESQRVSPIDDVQITVTPNEECGDRRGPAHRGRFKGNFVSRNIKSSARTHRTEIETK